MYFPKSFSKPLSIELAELVVQAYDQFAAFEAETPWKLPEKYSLVKELHYTWKLNKVIEKNSLNFDQSIRKTISLKRHKKLTIPIGFIAKSKDKIYLIYRGTKTAKEWIRNLSINLKEYPIPKYGKTHEGFLQVYNSTRDIILETLSEMKKVNGLFVAGHSLGAALATLSLPDIEMNTKIKINSLYTYGSPRVGDNTFVNTYNNSFGQKSYRIINTADIVTSIPLPIPLAWLVGGYFSHVDTPVNFTTQHDDLEQNHDMETYLKALNNSKEQGGFIKKLIKCF